MKYLPLIWAGLWRKRVRTILTLLSVIVAFVLFGVMHGVTAGIDQIVNQMSDSRLRIQSRVNITEALPLAYLARIESVPGVLGVGFYNFVGTYYQEPRNQVSTGAMDMSRLRALFPEIEVSQQAIDAMAQTRNGALIGQDLATQRGWKVGDRIPLRSSVWMRKDGAPDWTFEIVGVYESAERQGTRPTSCGSTTDTSTRSVRSVTARSRCISCESTSRRVPPRSPSRSTACSRTRRTRPRRRTSAIGSGAASLRSATWRSS